MMEFNTGKENMHTKFKDGNTSSFRMISANDIFDKCFREF